MEPRVGGNRLPSPVTVAPARPPGQEGPHLPWTGSAAGPEFPLSYMPFMEHMLNVLAQTFGGEMTALPLADKLAFVENPEKKARMLRYEIYNVVFYIVPMYPSIYRYYLYRTLYDGCMTHVVVYFRRFGL